MGEKLAKTKDADIHIRCFREDKKYVESRAKDGFGKKTNSMTNFVLYAIRHVDDSSPIDIEQAEGLIQTIGDNRQTLAAVHEDINGIPQELNELGNNLNQIAKATNTILRTAREDDETQKETIDKIVASRLFSRQEPASTVLFVRKMRFLPGVWYFRPLVKKPGVMRNSFGCFRTSRSQQNNLLI